MSNAESPTPAEIIQRRTENNLSQVAAARMIPGVSVSAWRAWEYGQNPMHPGLWELFTLKLLMDRKIKTSALASTPASPESAPG